MRVPAATALTSALLLAACHAGQGPGLSAQGNGPVRTYTASGFTDVALAGSDDVSVRASDKFSVRAEGDPAVLDALRIGREGDTLTVSRKDGTQVSGKAKVFVTLPRLAKAVVAGSGTMAAEGVSGDGFEGVSTGSGSLQLRSFAMRKAELTVAGSGDVSAVGQADALTVSIAGTGNVDASGTQAKRADVTIAGSGRLRAAVDGPAKVTIMGSGDVDLGPKARCDTTKMGSGSVRCGG